ncbi:MAG: hypothetical protein IPF58_09640 [Saprospirales bacterium]|nr:hypothetical protein [Saprospirales bacterium]
MVSTDVLSTEEIVEELSISEQCQYGSRDLIDWGLVLLKFFSMVNAEITFKVEKMFGKLRKQVAKSENT